MNALNDLPDNVQKVLLDFCEQAKASCQSNLKSIILFGSAAEGRLRPTSDVNVMLLLSEFEVLQIDSLRESLRTARAAINLHVMFILESEFLLANEAFAVKFMDIAHRHRMLYGSDPFKEFTIPRQVTIQRLQQVIVNLKLRLRETYALVSLREEQLIPVIADVSGPIRACAAAILRLQGEQVDHPKEALQKLAQRLDIADWHDLLLGMSAAREHKFLDPGRAASLVIGLLKLLRAMNQHIQKMN